MTEAPERSYAQRLDALRRANDVRTYRAALKRDIAGGRCSIYGVIGEPEQRVLTMKVRELLLAVPKVGDVKAVKLLRVAQLSLSKTVGGMTDRQRRDLLCVMRARSVHDAADLERIAA